MTGADANLFVIDEIGKMECYSQRFVDLTERLLNSDTPVLATVAMKGAKLIQRVKERSEVELITVAVDNRDELAASLVEWVRQGRTALSSVLPASVSRMPSNPRADEPANIKSLLQSGAY